MAEGPLQGRDDGDFDLDLFFFGTEAASAHSQITPTLHREAESCAQNVQTGGGDAAHVANNGSALSSSHHGLASCTIPIMNPDLSSCFPRDSTWGVCNTNNLPEAPSSNSLDKAGQGDRSPADITSIIAHLRSLATETSNDCSRLEAERPKSSGDSSSSLDSLANETSAPSTSETPSKDCGDEQGGFQEGLLGDVRANQHLLVNVESNSKRRSSAKIYVCSECGKTSPCHSASIRHQRIHTGEKPYVCSQCHKSFIQVSDYNNHVRSHTGEKPYTCAECGKSFSRSTYLVTHSRTHTKEKPYTCNVCGKSFIQHSHLSLHLRIHSGEKPYICIECGNSFSRSSTLVKHKKSHRRKTLHICQKKNEDDIACNFTHNNPPTWGANADSAQLDQPPSATEPLQVKAETDEGVKCYPQTLNYRKRHRAGKKTLHKPSRVMLQKYLVNQGGTERGPITFPHPKKNVRKKDSQQPNPGFQDGLSNPDTETTKEPNSPKREITSSPPGDGLAPEGRCWSPEQGDEALDRSGENIKILKCEITGPAASSPDTPHVESSYEDPSQDKATLGSSERPHKGSPFICSYCGKSCPCKSAFLRHQRIHTGEKPYSCPDCGKSFIQASDYNNHMRTHTGEKPYTCSWCGKSFSRSTYLVTHSRTHTKEKPYTCMECGKSFIQHSHLAIHLRIHSGEKPYSCQDCGKRFSRSSALVKHQKSHYKKSETSDQSSASSAPSSGSSS